MASPPVSAGYAECSATISDEEAQQRVREVRCHHRPAWGRTVRITACGLAITAVVAPALVFWATRGVQPSSAVENRDTVNLNVFTDCEGVNCLWRDDLSCEEVSRFSANYRCCCNRIVHWWEKQGRVTIGRDQKKCMVVQFVNKQNMQLRRLQKTDDEFELLSSVDHLIASEDYLLSTTTVTTTHTTGVLVLETCRDSFDPLSMFDMTQGLPRRERMVHLEADHRLCWQVAGGGSEPFVELGRCTYETKKNRFLPPGISPGIIRWAANPAKCLDTSSPDGSEPRDEQVVRLKDCNASNPYQVFNTPQAAFETEAPSLFCISLMLPRTGEETLLKAQLELGMVGIFGCNEWSVYSNESRLLSIEPPVYSENVMNGSLWCAFGGQWHSALNTPIFLRFWHAVVWDERTWDHDWILKADPDTVFFPQRLRPLLRKRWWGGVTPGPTYLNNCDLGNHGPLTILNMEALALYKKKEQMCAAPFSDSRHQEDLWFRACLEHLGVRRVNAYNLLWEKAWACTEPPSWGCFSPQVAFHPYKNAKEWETCYWVAKDVAWDNNTIMSIQHGS